MILFVLIAIIAAIFFAGPAGAHIDHGVGGERIRFEPPPEVVKPKRNPEMFLAFRQPPRYTGRLQRHDFSEGITVSAWIYRTSEGSPDAVVTQWNQLNRGAFALVAGRGPEGGFHLRWSDGSVARAGGFDVPIARWVHYAGVFDGDRMVVYLDGASVATLAARGKIAASGDSILIGGSGLSEAPTSALIDDVEVWDRGLTREEVVRLGEGDTPPGSIGRWTFEGEDPVDTRVLYAKDRGRAGTVLRFDRHAGIALNRSRTDRMDRAFSVAAWVYNRGTDRPGGAVVGQWGEDPGDRRLVLYSVGGDGMGFRTYWRDGTQNNLTVVDTPGEVWFHYAATYDGRELRLYVNGVAMGRTIAVDKRLAQVDRPMVIGGIDTTGSIPFNGFLDGIALWDRALTEDEVGAVMRGPGGQSALLRMTSDRLPSSGGAYSINSIPPPTLAQVAAAGRTDQLAGHLEGRDTVEVTVAFWWAALHGHRAAMRTLLEAGAWIDEKLGFGGHTALHAAVADKRFATVQFLVDQGADVNLEDDTYHSPAWGWAGQFGHAVLKTYLLDAASNDNLYAAIEYDALERARRLVATSDGWDLERGLRVAATFGRPEIIQALLDAGADPGTRDGAGRSAEDLAVTRSRFASVDVLRTHRGVDVSGVSSFRERVEALDRAIDDRDSAVIDSLIRIDPALIRADPTDDRTWLQRAADVDDAEIARKLVEAGAELDRVRNHHTALSWAVTTGATDVADILLAAGDELDLFTAAGLGRLPEVKRFFTNGKVIDASSRTGSTRLDENREVIQIPPFTGGERVADALYIASRNGHGAVVAFLLAKGADPDFRAERGGTALYWATLEERVEVVEVLLKAGADPAIPDRYGRNPVQIALRSGNERLRALLTTKG